MRFNLNYLTKMLNNMNEELELIGSSDRYYIHIYNEYLDHMIKEPEDYYYLKIALLDKDTANVLDESYIIKMRENHNILVTYDYKTNIHKEFNLDLIRYKK